MSTNTFIVDSPIIQLPGLLNTTTLTILSFSQTISNSVVFTFNKTINKVLFAQVSTYTVSGPNQYTLTSTVSGKTITLVSSVILPDPERSEYIKLNVTATDGSSFVGAIPFSGLIIS